MANNKKLSLNPLKFKEAVADILRVKPEPKPKKKGKKGKGRKGIIPIISEAGTLRLVLFCDGQAEGWASGFSYISRC